MKQKTERDPLRDRAFSFSSRSVFCFESPIAGVILEPISKIAFEPRGEISKASPEMEGEEYPRYFEPEARWRCTKYPLVEPEWIFEIGSK